MNPGRGVDQLSSACRLFFLLLHLVSAQLAQQEGGNVGEYVHQVKNHRYLSRVTCTFK